MALLPWRPAEELSALQREMNRLFEQFFGERPRLDIAHGGWMPRMDMVEMNDSLTITAELPGLEAKDVDVALAGDTLTIKGEKTQEHEDKAETHHVMERTYGAFSRMVRLPVPVSADKVKATFTNGVLTISLPKTEAARQRAIPINVG
jgi:HSP20 family protein